MATEYAYKSTLKKSYGLPDGWIALLGAPDLTVPNPHYRSGPPSSLYLRIRVDQLIEQRQDEYQALLQQRAIRQARGKAIADQRAQELKVWAETVVNHS